ncbi:MAG TPA: thioesterase family protein [Acidimicrobiia bacterium]|nr:thioesterase family protein [Acidimicrobiia bacterium]
MSAAHAYPHATDLALVPLRFDAGHSCGRFALTPDLARHDGVLYGGTGAAVAVMMMEAATQRAALWVATQFVAQARLGEHIDVEARTLAAGKRIAQLEVVARVDDRVIFTALGATAHPRPDGLTGQYEDMPPVTAPDDSPPLHHRSPAPPLRDLGFSRNLEFREATLDEPDPRAMALWARITPAPRPMTPAGVAYVADMVPGAIARAAGKIGGGFSLDNALRFAEVAPAEWVLLHLRGDVASHGYGHGSFTAWSSAGALLATGSQTASMTHVFDESDHAQMAEWRERIAQAAAHARTAPAEGANRG